MNNAGAEDLACAAVAWLAADGEVSAAFLAETGANPQALRAAAKDPAFLAAIVDFILADERWARGFCTAQGITAETLHAARAHLPGGDSPHWT